MSHQDVREKATLNKLEAPFLAEVLLDVLVDSYEDPTRSLLLWLAAVDCARAAEI